MLVVVAAVQTTNLRRDCRAEACKFMTITDVRISISEVGQSVARCDL